MTELAVNSEVTYLEKRVLTLLDDREKLEGTCSDPSVARAIGKIDRGIVIALERLLALGYEGGAINKNRLKEIRSNFLV